jgi:hypothetical protein
MTNLILSAIVYLMTNGPTTMTWYEKDKDLVRGTHSLCPYKVQVTFTCEPTNHYQVSYSEGPVGVEESYQWSWDFISPRLGSTNSETITYITGAPTPSFYLNIRQFPGYTNASFDPFTNTASGGCVTRAWPSNFYTCPLVVGTNSHGTNGPPSPP